MTTQDKPIIPLTKDIMFSLVFNNEQNICVLEEFLSVYLEIELERLRGHLTLLSRKQTNESKSVAQTEVDILLDLDGDKVIIEMNANGFYESIRKRNLIYAAKALSKEYKIGDTKLKNAHSVLQINFNTKPTKIGEKKLERLINEFELSERNNPKLKYSNLLRIDVIDMVKSKEERYNYVDER